MIRTIAAVAAAVAVTGAAALAAVGVGGAGLSISGVHHGHGVPSPNTGPKPALHHFGGNPGDWTWLGGTADGTPRWDPCASITWSAPHDGSYVERALTRGIHKLARFTGYSFVRVPDGGQVTAVAVPTDDAGLVALTAAAYVSLDYAPDAEGVDRWITSAQVRISVDYTVEVVASVGSDFKAYTLPIMLHELGHAMGLGHAGSQDEAMMPGPSAKQYGAGDRAGLASVRPDTCAPVGDLEPARSGDKAQRVE